MIEKIVCLLGIHYWEGVRCINLNRVKWPTVMYHVKVEYKPNTHIDMMPTRLVANTFMDQFAIIRCRECGKAELSPTGKVEMSTS